jgi:DNA mismatch repair protein MutS
MTQSLSQERIEAVDPAQLTPAMRQYQQYKVQYPDAILFFRMGDFYETFYEDARTAARVLGVALTARSKGENPVPMAGVPFHALETYLHRMIAAGYKVAICEQMEDPRIAKGVIKREVVRLVTPGTITEEALLDNREENFIAAIVLAGKEATPTLSGEKDYAQLAAIAWCELSTGKFLTMNGPLVACEEELARVRPRELIYAEASDHRVPENIAHLREMLGLVLTSRPAWQLDAHEAMTTLRNHYGVAGFMGFGYLNEKDASLRAAGALVGYLHETQKTALEHLRPPIPFARERHLVIDPTSLRSLEVLRTIRGNTVDGSLVGALDRTATPMGARLLKNWLCFPLRDVNLIRQRQDAIGTLLENEHALTQLRLVLRDCTDIERITARICCRRASPRDLMALARSLETLCAVAKLLAGLPAGEKHWATLLERVPAANEIAAAIRATIGDEPPAHLRDGNCIRDGYNAELDRLRTLSRDSRTWLAEYQSKLVASTGISSLKVGYNKVFGFYIEITHTHADKIPATFIRKQTVKNAERYITPELKQYEADVLTAQERSVALEQELYEALRGALALQVEPLQQLAEAAAALDVYAGLAHLARTRHYCRPEFTDTRELKLVDARHPVVEQLLEEKFVPNDANFPIDGATLQLITGPNMAGKSTYIRQVALLTLMAQAGAYVPAKEATLGMVDRIFTRVGASDDLAGGQSTFMVEMTETANILLHATEQSLVILDEIGRGTSTLDGLALAWAIAEYMADTAGCRTLFATHYHELTELAESSPKVVNYNVLVREWEDQVVFMHRIVPGKADQSYGIHVAKLAGVPRSVIHRARTLLNQLTVHIGKARPRAATTQVPPQISLFDTHQQQTVARLRALDMNRMSPMQAWEALKALQALLEENKL